MVKAKLAAHNAEIERRLLAGERIRLDYTQQCTMANRWGHALKSEQQTITTGIARPQKLKVRFYYLDLEKKED